MLIPGRRQATVSWRIVGLRAGMRAVGRGNQWREKMREKLIVLTVIALMISVVPGLPADENPLKRYVELALGQNLQVEISRTDVEEAHRERDAAAAAFYPTAEFNYRHTRINREISFDIPIPGFSESVVVSSLWQWQAAFSGRVPIYTGGKLSRALELSEAVLSGRESSLGASERDVAMQVVDAYLDLKMAVALEQVQSASLEIAKEHQRVVAAMLDQGMVSLRELKRAEASVAEAESQLIAAGNAAQLSKRVFNYLLNRGLEEEIDASSEPEWNDEYDLGKAIEDAMRSRPELSALEQGMVAGDKQIALARADYYPNLSLAAEGGWRDGDMMSIAGRDYWQVSLLAGITIFDGTREDRVASARAARRREGLVLESTRKRIELQVTESYLRLVDARKQLSAAEREKGAAEEALRVAELQFKQGVADQVTFLDAELAMTAARVRTEQSHYLVLKAEASLRYAAGYSLP
jgi:outer membrane protein TolC